MAKLGIKEIQDLAIQIVRNNPGGIRGSDLVRAIAAQNPETNGNSIHTQVWALDKNCPSQVNKPSRGLFKALDPRDGAVSPQISSIEILESKKIREDDFYKLFAEWLETDLDEATTAVAMGGEGFQTKWGTPDVVGIYKPLAGNRIKFDVEIISAEIKIDPRESVVAFGQAAAYRLFSAKSYVVMPKTISPEDYSRLEALCMLFGVGLALFKLDLENPEFSIRVRAQRFLPDMFYVNEFADRLYQLDASVFNKLFG